MSILEFNKSNWYARLELEYKKSRNKTILSHRLHKGPLVIQKPFYPEEDVCHSYLIHPPGGIVGGDILELDVVLLKGSHALITTPAANKFYRSDNKYAQLYQSIRISDGAILEWLPQETIFFNSCNAQIKTDFHLEGDAQLVCWEINCFGRPASNDYFEQGNIIQKISINKDGTPLYIDRNVFNAETKILSEKWGLNKFPVMATMLVTMPDKSDAIDFEPIQVLQEHTQRLIFTVTVRENILLVRYFGYHAREALSLLTQCWSSMRPQLIKKKSCPPRIWET